MRTADRVGRTVVLRLRFDDFTRVTRSYSLPHATAHTATVLVAAKTLLRDARPMIVQRGLTLVGITVGNLENDDAVQLALPFDRSSGGALDVALDDLRERFGSSAVKRAAQLAVGEGWTVPMLPD
jgi:DNA polymerase-4